jgi:hypothetical protein
MKVRRYGTRSLSLAIGLIALVLPTSASAAIEVGETFDPSAGGNCGASGLTLLQTVSPNDQYEVPAPGVITAWSFQASASPPLLKLKIGRPAGGNNFTIVGESFFKFPSPNALNTYTDVRIPVEAGDIVGFYLASDGHCGRVSDSHFFHGTSGDIPPGTTTSMTLASATVQLDVSATLEPDCDSDGFGDETQDAVADCVVPAAQLTKRPKDKIKTKKKRAKATFEFTGTDARAIASFQCSVDGVAFTPCASPHTVKVKKGQHTFQVRAVDQAGNVSVPATDTWKVKKKKKKS